MKQPASDAVAELCTCGHGVESHSLTDSQYSPSGVYCNEFVVIADGHFLNRRIQCPCESFTRMGTRLEPKKPNNDYELLEARADWFIRQSQRGGPLDHADVLAFAKGVKRMIGSAMATKQALIAGIAATGMSGEMPDKEWQAVIESIGGWEQFG